MRRLAPLAAAIALAGCSDQARVDAVEVVDGGRALRVYVIGTPVMESDGVDVEETAREIRITATVDRPFGGADDGPAVYYCSELDLERPVGRRRIVDVSRDEVVERGRRPCVDGG